MAIQARRPPYCMLHHHLSIMSVNQPLFTGNTNPTLIANILHSHWRIAEAIQHFPQDLPESVYRPRWRIGLYHEVVRVPSCFVLAFLYVCLHLYRWRSKTPLVRRWYLASPVAHSLRKTFLGSSSQMTKSLSFDGIGFPIS